MNKREHVLNAILLGLGLGVVFHVERPESVLASPDLAVTVVEVGVPVVLGALFPDVDTAFGTHRQTFHNLPVLGGFYAFPALFGNLHLVWVGILTHYVLDLLGTVRGMALLYPYSREFDVPVGVPSSSWMAPVVTVAITALELAAVALIVAYQLPVVSLNPTPVALPLG